jgi:uncharacterized membrane protein
VFQEDVKMTNRSQFNNFIIAFSTSVFWLLVVCIGDVSFLLPALKKALQAIISKNYFVGVLGNSSSHSFCQIYP